MPGAKGVGGRMTHEVPLWVHPDDHFFHIRIRQARKDPVALTEPVRARLLLESAIFYDSRGKWGISLFLLMPDHLHALMYLPPERALEKTMGNWKAYHTRFNGLAWQDNFFDHRIRSEKSEIEQADYIRKNPVAAGLCQTIDDWPWWVGRRPDGSLNKGWTQVDVDVRSR